MNRRSFVRTGIATASLSSGLLAQNPASTAAPGPEKAKISSSVMLWTLKGSFEERMETAAAAGLQSVELVGEHTKWTDADIARVKNLARSLRLGIDTLSSTPNWKGMPVSMVDPAQRENLLKEVQNNLDFARKLEIPMALLMSGDEIPGRTHEAQYASLLEGCKRCGDLAAKAGITLIVEPLNSKVNHKGFFLTTCVEGLKLIKETDNPYVRLLFDIYHEQVQTGNVIQTLKAAAPYTRVFHVADNPGRNDPGTGEMNYANIYRAIRETGYDGFVTMEYLPKGEPVASLKKAVDDMRAAIA
jgi:hydroxypyruvate isomerase